MNIMINYGQWMQAVLVPLIFVFLGLFAKQLGRRDGDNTPPINDWAVGTSIVLMTISHISADLLAFEETDKKISTSVLVFILLLFFFLYSIYHDRNRSWKKDKQTGIKTGEKSLFVGVLLPNLISVILFIIYQLLKNY